MLPTHWNVHGELSVSLQLSVHSAPVTSHTHFTLCLIGDDILPSLFDILVECVLVQTINAPFSLSENFYYPPTPVMVYCIEQVLHCILYGDLLELLLHCIL